MSTVRRAGLLTGFVIVGGLLAAPATMAEEFRHNCGILLGAVASWDHVGGDLKGNSVLYRSNEVDVLPLVSDGVGYGGLLGWRGVFYDGLSLLVGFQESEHRSRWGGTSYRTVFDSGYFAAKVNFMAHRRLQPYLLYQASLPMLEIKDGSYGPTGNRASAFLGGSGKSFGFGIEWFPDWLENYSNSGFALTLGYLYRKIAYDTATGWQNREATIVSPLSGDTQSIQLGASWTFDIRL